MLEGSRRTEELELGMCHWLSVFKKNVAGISSRHKHEDIPSHQGDPFLSDEITCIVPNFPAVVRGEIWTRGRPRLVSGATIPLTNPKQTPALIARMHVGPPVPGDSLEVRPYTIPRLAQMLRAAIRQQCREVGDGRRGGCYHAARPSAVSLRSAVRGRCGYGTGQRRDNRSGESAASGEEYKCGA